MKNHIFILILTFLLWSNLFFAQDSNNKSVVVNDSIKSKKSDDINPLAPSKAAFLSAILPGLGQAYNKKYWKIPIVYGALGTAVYFYIDSNNKYNLFRNAYKQRLAGQTTDAFTFLSNDRLISGQKFYQRNRDLSTIFIVVVYMLNVVDANVDAHLLQYNVNDKLSLSPDILNNDFNNQKNIGLSFRIKL